MKLVHTLSQIQGGFNFQEDVYAPTAKFVEENKQALAITGCVLAATGAVFAAYKYGAFSLFTSKVKVEDKGPELNNSVAADAPVDLSVAGE